MEIALCEKIIHEAHQMGTFRFILGGHGEPLLHPQFDRILSLLVRLKKSPYIITNGLAIDKGYVKYLSKHSAHFRISLHAGDPETWHRVHPTGEAGQFEQLSDAIRHLSCSGAATVSLMNVIQKANFKHILKMVEHAHLLGVKRILFMPVRAEAVLSQVLLNNDEQQESREHLQRALGYARRHGIRTNISEYLSTNRLVRCGIPDTRDLYRNIPCYIGWIYSEFDTDGAMRPCENAELVMGNAGGQHLKEMWLSKRYQHFRHESLNLTAKDEGISGCLCHECPMSKFNINVHRLLTFKSIRYGEP